MHALHPSFALKGLGPSLSVELASQYELYELSVTYVKIFLGCLKIILRTDHHLVGNKYK